MQLLFYSYFVPFFLHCDVDLLVRVKCTSDGDIGGLVRSNHVSLAGCTEQRSL